MPPSFVVFEILCLNCFWMVGLFSPVFQSLGQVIAHTILFALFQLFFFFFCDLPLGLRASKRPWVLRFGSVRLALAAVCFRDMLVCAVRLGTATHLPPSHLPPPTTHFPPHLLPPTSHLTSHLPHFPPTPTSHLGRWR